MTTPPTGDSERSRPGYFFRSGPAGVPRRTLIFNNGSDGSVVGAWTGGMADALERGWNAMTFDGPGQNAALVRQGLAFRPDWEKVITPVVDFLSARADVDAARLALLGVSQGGYWVPRALAFEHRIAAAVTDPGVVDVSATILRHLPHTMIRLLEERNREKFDRDIDWTLRISPSTSSPGRRRRSSRSPRRRGPTRTASPPRPGCAASASSTG